MLPIVLGKGPETQLQVLCLGAHSDDIEIGCGGTVLRLLSEYPRCSVHWVVFSSNPEREREARSSAAEFLKEATESNLVIRDFRESYFPYIASQIKDFFETLKQSVNPDLVFSHHRQDVHQDHRLIADLCWNTFRNHLIFEYEIQKYEGDLGQPALFVPLSRKVAEQKTALLLRHFASQRSRSWFRAEVFDGLMAVRGVECNAADGRAEAFHLRKCIL